MHLSAGVWFFTLFRPEMVVGWYHSHPGFGCWLSSVDCNTQQVRFSHPSPLFCSLALPLYLALLLESSRERSLQTDLSFGVCQSFEQLNPRAVAVVIDPIQSVKGKVVIDAFRLINPQTLVSPPFPFLPPDLSCVYCFLPCLSATFPSSRLARSLQKVVH